MVIDIQDHYNSNTKVLLLRSLARPAPLDKADTIHYLLASWETWSFFALVELNVLNKLWPHACESGKSKQSFNFD